MLGDKSKYYTREALSMDNSNTVKSYFESTLLNHPVECTSVVPNINNIKITASYEDVNYIGFDCVSTSEEGICKHCGQLLSKVKDRRTCYVTIGMFNLKPIVLRLTKKLYYCPDCSKSTIERLLDTTGNQQRTDSFLNSMIDMLKENICYSVVARINKISVSNLIRHFDKKELRETQIDLSSIKNLSIDETRIIKNRKLGNYQCVLMDSDTKKIVSILKTREKRYIKEFIGNMFESVDTLTQDLWNPYRSVGKTLFPKCDVIADPFHVVRQFMWAFSRTRIEIAKESKQSTNKNWKILTKREQSLDAVGKEKLSKILSENHKLKIAHEAKEFALELFRSNTKDQYLSRLEYFEYFIQEHKLIEFEKALKSIKNWQEEIINMIYYPYSNGSMERANRIIKQSKNAAFGFSILARTKKLIQYRIN